MAGLPDEPGLREDERPVQPDDGVGDVVHFLAPLPFGERVHEHAEHLCRVGVVLTAGCHMNPKKQIRE